MRTDRLLQPYLIRWLAVGMVAVLLAACKTVKLKDAEDRQRLGEYYAAAEMYRKLYTKSKPDQKDLRAYVAFRMGLCNQRINNNGRAISAYLNALRYDYPDSLLRFYLAQVCQREGLYELVFLGAGRLKVKSV